MTHTSILQETPRLAESVRHEIEDFARFLPSIAHLPMDEFNTEYHRRLNRISDRSWEYPGERSDIVKAMFDVFDGHDLGIMQHHSLYKPLGYAGDYLIIDWIYERRADSLGIGGLWDEFYQRQAAPQAVRNRKQYFIDLFGSLCRKTGHGISVLDLACGPCRDVVEAVARAGSAAFGSYLHCVDMDSRAIEYAEDLTCCVADRVSLEWENKNVFLLRPGRKYDLVWSAGLFDYLDDRQAVLLLRKMWSWTADGGLMAVGNFHPDNPTRNYMEWCGGWRLIHRTDDDYARLCQAAGIPAGTVSFDREATGACMFCLARKQEAR